MMNEQLFGIAPASAIIALVFAVFYFKQMVKCDEGADLMIESL